MSSSVSGARLAVLIAFAVLAAVPFFLPPYYVTLMLPALAYGVILLGFNLLFGYTGLLSFGHALFVCMGAYTIAALSSRFGETRMELILLIAVVIGFVVAVPVGMLCVRYVRIFFGMLFHSFLFKFYDITGGDSGIPIVRPLLLGRDYADLDKTAFLTGPFYYYSLGLLLLLGWLMWRIVHSPFGVHLRSISDNPRKAEYVGVNVYGAVGGLLLAVPTSLADPELAYWTHSGNLAFMTGLGGFGNFFGPLLGAFVFIGLQDQLMSLTQYWRFALGVILIVIGLPKGLMGLLDARGRRGANQEAKS
ncbi:MAG: branched-chain amino acid ABC transporter permease [Candidatus Protistobacter heckmanni]|nr:branched-chain amino acid ABC transporter permease [Candidatus Protistobacter heckmanni]